MKGFFIKYWSLLIVGSATIIFCLAAIMQNIFNMELKDSLSLIIAFIGIFTTFGGAYLGAKISGENAVNLSKNQMIIEDLKQYQINNKNFIEDIEKSDVFNKNVQLIKEIRSIENLFDVFKCKNALNELSEYLQKLDRNYKGNLSNIVYYPYYIYLSSLTELLNNLITFVENTKKREREKLVEKIKIIENFSSYENTENEFWKNDFNLVHFDTFESLYNNDNDLINCEYEIVENREEIHNIISEYKNNNRFNCAEFGEFIGKTYRTNGKIRKEKLQINFKDLSDIYNIDKINRNNFNELLNKIHTNYKNIKFKKINEYNEYIFKFYKTE